MKISQKILLTINVLIIATIFVLNYFYQTNGFDFTLKCICSGMFSVLGVINLVYALKFKQNNTKFYISMSLGLILAFLGDYLIGYDFIIGAATFAVGHICFVIAYCFIEKPKIPDLIFSAILFFGAATFLLFSPLLTFEVPMFRIVCLVYGLIISTMLGKALGNLFSDRGIVCTIIAVASFLFFFSDLMLVLDWFVGIWEWTDNACMGTYYPALCLLAFSMCTKIIKNR